jgi:hypothetical protein
MPRAITFASRLRTTILAQACLGILLRLDDRIDRGNIEDFPLARYASQYRARHARVGNVSSRVKDGVECLFDADKPPLATWVWIYDEDPWCTSMQTMRPEKPKALAVPLYYAARLGFRDLAEHLIANAGQWLMPGIAKATLHFKLLGSTTGKHPTCAIITGTRRRSQCSRQTGRHPIPIGVM